MQNNLSHDAAYQMWLIWNEQFEGTPIKPCRMLTAHRRKKLKLRYDDTFDNPDIFSHPDPFTNFANFCLTIKHSNFLMGYNDRGWIATFDWCLEPRNVCKIIEGNYVNRTPQGGKRVNRERFISDCLDGIAGRL